MSFFSSIAPVAGAVIGGLLAAPTGGMSLVEGAALGGMFGGGVSSAMAADEAVKAQNSANETNIALQKEAQDWQLNLANTAHQREVADLKAAGLNPLLSVNKGAATPSVAPAQVQSSASAILEGNRGMRDSVMNSMNMQLIQSQIANQKSQALVNSAQAVSVGEEARRRAMENDILETEKNIRRYEASRRVSRPNWQKNLGIDVKDSVGSVIDPLRDLFRK